MAYSSQCQSRDDDDDDDEDKFRFNEALTHEGHLHQNDQSRNSRMVNVDTASKYTCQ